MCIKLCTTDSISEMVIALIFDACQAIARSHLRVDWKRTLVKKYSRTHTVMDVWFKFMKGFARIEYFHTPIMQH